MASSSSGGSSSGSSSGSGGDSGSKASSSSSSSSSSGSSGSHVDAGAADPDQACHAQTGDACDKCCADHHPVGASGREDLWAKCVCDPSRCQAKCAQTDCSDNADAGAAAPGDPCDLCEQQFAPDDGGGACGPIIDTACKGDPECVAYTACSDACN
jgi:hypothetical protein